MTDITPASASFEPIIEVARQAAIPQELQPGRIYSIHTADGEHEIVDLTGDEALSGWRPTPYRKKGCFGFTSPASFSSYVLAQGETGRVTIWADLTDLKVVGILNGHVNQPNDCFDVFSRHVEEEDHSAAGAGWGDHTAVLRLQPTDEWNAWTSFAGQQHPQASFADFIEDHLADIVEPDAALLLEVAQSITGTTNAKFNSRYRLDNGQVQIGYEEEISTSAGVKGQITVPQRLRLGIPPFLGSEVFAVEARLRVRIDKAALTLGVYLDRLHVVKEMAFKQATDEIEATTGVPVYAGWPPLP